MKTVSLLITILFLSIGFNACNNEADCEEGTPNPNCACYEIYAPVCGCNNVTYSNDCHAECAGVSDYTEGVCP